MRKDTFYRCVRDKEKGITAVKTVGQSENGIGLHKELDLWVATHIESGTRITPHPSTHKTAKAALAEALKRISNDVFFEKRLNDWYKSDRYEAFQKSRYEQSVTGVF